MAVNQKSGPISGENAGSPAGGRAGLTEGQCHPEIYRAIEALQRLSALYEQRRAQIAKDVGLSEQQWSVLEEVGNEGFIPSLFARRGASSLPSISRTLRQLMERGLVRTSIAQSDGRQRHYELTSTGQKKLAEIRALREAAIEAIWGGLKLDELKGFSRVSHALIERMQSYIAEH